MPQRLRIGCVVYEVINVKCGVDGIQIPGINGGRRGTCNSDDLIIELDATMHPDRKFATLMHEIAHAMLHEWNIGIESEREEMLVGGMGHAMAQVLRDNWKLLEKYKP